VTRVPARIAPDIPALTAVAALHTAINNLPSVTTGHAILNLYVRIGESQSLRFSWDVFNVTNAVRFDVGPLSQYLLFQPLLGDFTQTLPHPRVMQFRLRYSF